MNRLVPLSIKLLKRVRVPPILVKLSTVQPCYFCEKVAHIFEDQVEAEDDEACAWKHESQDKLNQGYLVSFFYPRLDGLSMMHVYYH